MFSALSPEYAVSNVKKIKLKKKSSDEQKMTGVFANIGAINPLSV